MRKYFIFLKYWKSLSIGIVILLLCLIPSKELRKIDLLNIRFEDLAAHLIMFIIFSAFLYLDMKKYFAGSEKQPRISLIVTAAGTLLGMMTEIFQYIFTILKRTANPVDLLFDIAGTLAGIGLIKLVKK